MRGQTEVLQGPPMPAPEPMRAEPAPAEPWPTPLHGNGAAPRNGTLSEDGIGWIGAHGGAGTTTLARLIGGTDIGCRWPDTDLAEPSRALLVGRTNLDGLRAVSRALRVLKEGRHPAGLRLIGVVLMADAPGRLPDALISRVRVVRTIAPVYRVPWIEALRIGDAPRRLPKQLVRLADVTGVRTGPGRGQS